GVTVDAAHFRGEKVQAGLCLALGGFILFGKQIENKKRGEGAAEQIDDRQANRVWKGAPHKLRRRVEKALLKSLKSLRCLFNTRVIRSKTVRRLTISLVGFLLNECHFLDAVTIETQTQPQGCYGLPFFFV